ncbi:MAG: fructosamine kinase family protein [Burkholderiales bacterium]|nr:fructosamine kinase family protein [Burkholderiales bacterium]
MQDGLTREQLTVFFTRLARRVVEVRAVTPLPGATGLRTACATLADGTRVFVKTGRPDDLARLKAEAGGLAAIGGAAAIRVPDVHLVGGEGRHAYLVLEHLDLAPGSPEAYARMGRELAVLHRRQSPHFGFDRDNFIGATPQSNTIVRAWPDFFRAQRLLPQLRRIEGGDHAGMWVEGGLRVAESVDAFFPGYAPQPSLLHGDLWAGNAGFLADGTPVIFDPAVYYGDREADIAMSELFGGFGAAFRAAYRETWPLDPGYAVRRDLYNLYHVLNHVNLFGAAYVAQAQGLIRRLLAEIR